MRLNTRDTALLKRFVQGYYDDTGTWVQEDPYRERISCGIQPDYKGFQRYIEEEGIRAEDVLVVRFPLNFKVFTTNSDEGKAADILEIDGQDYFVDRAQNWRGPNRLRHQTLLLRRDFDGNRQPQ